jgi:hypothetical protein
MGFERMQDDIVWFLQSERLLFFGHVGVYAVERVHFVTRFHELPGQVLNVNGVAAKMVGRVEGRCHQDSQSCHHTSLILARLPNPIESALNFSLINRLTVNQFRKFCP